MLIFTGCRDFNPEWYSPISGAWWRMDQTYSVYYQDFMNSGKRRASNIGIKAGKLGQAFRSARPNAVNDSIV